MIKNLFFFALILLSIFSLHTNALAQNRLPICNSQNVYYINNYNNNNGAIYEYNTITNNHTLVYNTNQNIRFALAIGPILGTTPSSNINTYHLINNGTHHYIDPISLQLVNTNHTAIGANLSHGEKYIFNFDGVRTVSRYDGMSNAVSLGTFTYPTGEYGIMPGIISDCDDNFYLLTNKGLRQYDSTGTFIQRWDYTVGTRPPPSGGGMVMTEDSFYTIDGPNIRIFSKNNTNKTLTFARTIIGLGRAGSDLANCTGGRVNDINLLIVNNNCENNYSIILDNPNSNTIISKRWFINGNPIININDTLTRIFGPQDTQVVCQIMFEDVCGGNAIKSDTVSIRAGNAIEIINELLGCQKITLKNIEYTQNTIVRDTIKSNLGCDSIINIYDIKITSPYAINKDTALCEGDNWLHDGQPITNSGRYEWKYISHAGCDSIIIYNVTIHPKPKIQIKNIDNDPVCINDTIHLDFGTNAKINVEGFNVTDGKLDIIVKKEHTKLFLTLTNDGGCEYNDSLEVAGKYCCDFWVPNAFTPNKDGVNDFFKPILHTTSINQYLFRIFNRWGENVFTSYKLNSTWDGTYKGKACETGVYFYIIEYDCRGEKQQIKGEINLLR